MSPLLFLHGVGGGSAAWVRQLAHFRALGRHAVAWNQPGYGGRPAVEPYDLERIAAAAVHEVDALGAPAVLIGHSMGGFVAQELYARRPDNIRALVLAFTSPAFGGTGSDFARQFIAARIRPLDEGCSMAEIATALMKTMQGTRSEPEGLALAQSVMAAVPPETYRKAVALLTGFDRRAGLGDIRVPVLLVAGSDDRTAPAAVMERMAQKIADAEYVCLEGCGHLGPMDQPARFNTVLEDFLVRRAL